MLRSQLAQMHTKPRGKTVKNQLEQGGQQEHLDGCVKQQPLSFRLSSIWLS
jgi:hypothetical protein